MLYIANATKQTFRFMHRVPETGKTLVVDIPSGQQRAIGDNWSSAQKDVAIAHIERFGGRAVTDTRITPSDFDGVLYSHKPIVAERIEQLHGVVVDKQEARSVKEATRSALAFDVANRDKTGKRRAKVSEVEVEQEQDKRVSADGMKFSVTVDPTVNNEV